MARKQTPSGKRAIGAAEFKARCLELMDKVRETRAEYILTKHGTPVAKLVPYDAAGRPKKVFGSMRGTVLRYDRPFDPVPGEWFMDPLVVEKKARNARKEKKA